MRKNFIVCDMCDVKVDGDKFPEGWVEINSMEINNEKLGLHDFCSKQCLFEFFREKLPKTFDKNERTRLREIEMQREREEEIFREKQRQEDLIRKQEALANRTQKIELDDGDSMVEEVTNPDEKKKRFGFFG